LLKVATPATAATVAVPVSVAPPGLASRPIVTDPPNPLATLPLPSRAVTSTAGAIGDPAVAADGCTVNSSRVATACSAVAVNVTNCDGLKLASNASGPATVPTVAVVCAKP